jgi:HlyD family secretion protein
MKKFIKLLKSKVFWVVVVLLVATGTYAYVQANKEVVIEYVTEPVKRGDLQQTVSATGRVESASEINLNFNTSGQISFVRTKVGDKVTQGAVLAQLRANDLVISVNRARAAVQEAQANLDRVLAGSTNQDLAVLEASVDRAKSDLDTAYSNLENTEKTYKQAIENKKVDVLDQVNNYITRSQIATQKVYDIINFRGDDDNFSVSNPQLYISVKSDHAAAISAVDELKLLYNTAKLNPSDQAIDSLLTGSQQPVQVVARLMENMFNLLDYVILTPRLTQTDLDGMKTTMSTERTTIASAQASLQSAKQAVADAKVTLATKTQESKNSITAAEKNLEKAEADLNAKKAPARSEDVAIYQAQVARAQADLELAQDRLNDTIIRAPITGVVTEVNFSAGEQANSSEPVIVMLADEKYEIQVDIPESDIAKVGVGQDADISLDAFSQDQVFAGVVTNIDPAQTEIQDVIYYQVTVSFKPEQPEGLADINESIKPGMTANVKIKTALAQDVLIIPARAVTEVDGERFVKVLEGTTPREILVVLGLRGDDGLVVVRSGLSEDQQVITFTPR